MFAVGMILGVVLGGIVGMLIMACISAGGDEK